MSLNKDLEELIQNKIINRELADKIQKYFELKDSQSSNRLYIIFGVFGSTLVGLGIILILAHNWDELSRTTRTLLSFLPLVIVQALCLFVLLKKMENTGWRESVCALLFFAIGGSISLIAQVYNIPGNLNSFLLTWMLLILPIAYILNSSITSALYLIGITTYACNVGYFSSQGQIPYHYWLLLVAISPFYYQKIKSSPQSNFTSLLHWIVTLSVTICLGTIAESATKIMVLDYMSLFGLIYLIGSLPFIRHQKLSTNAYKVSGAIGILYMLFFLSFDEFWSHFSFSDLPTNGFYSPESLMAILLTIASGWMLYLDWTQHRFNNDPLKFTFLIFVFIFIVNLFAPMGMILINLITLVIGILIIKAGSQKSNLGQLNFGLLIVSVLIICRFFDQDQTFIVRGLMFVTVGLAFFISNYLAIKRKKG